MFSATEYRDLIPPFVCTYVWVYLHMYTYIFRGSIHTWKEIRVHDVVRIVNPFSMRFRFQRND